MSEENGPVSRGLMVLIACNVGAWIYAASSIERVASALAVERESAQSHSQPEATPVAEERPDQQRIDSLNVTGITDPVMHTAEQADVEDDARVIGITVNDHARAYLLEAFAVTGFSNPEDVSAHVVNDVIRGQSICVTHCDVTHSTRVFRSGKSPDSSARPFEVCVGGWDAGLLLKVDGVQYEQHSPKVPLSDIPFAITTWGHWIAEHPDSRVYVGRPSGHP